MAVSESPHFEPLEQVYALNRLFLSYLRARIQSGGDCLAIPEVARGALLAASDSVLDSVAEFPRALFELRLGESPASGAAYVPASAEESARHSLGITILLCAWQLSRHHVGQARFLLGLDSRAIQHLRRLRLEDLPRYAGTPALLRCAFSHCAWLWVELLSERGPEARRQLVLVALQPAFSEGLEAASA